MKATQKIALSLAIFYMIAVTGIAFNLHFCGGKLDAVALFNETISCKMCGKMASIQKENSCCKNSKIEVKVKDNHQACAKLELSKNFEFQLAAPYYYVNVQRTAAIIKDFHPIDAPPKLNYPSTNILHCTFRI